MQKIALFIAFGGLLVTGVGIYTNNPTTRSLGIKVLLVGLVLFLFSAFTDLPIFPSLKIS